MTLEDYRKIVAILKKERELYRSKVGVGGEDIGVLADLCRAITALESVTYRYGAE